jgi:hypothetical protein
MKLEHPLSKCFFSLADEVKKNLCLQLQLRVKQEVLQSVSKVQLGALLDGPVGTSGLTTGSSFVAGI